MNRGFTLIEVIVVIAIVSILAGVMIPFIYRVWESADVETTKERMSDLKKAMVGDPRLIQNGVRIHYGYVGDCGGLPSALEILVDEGKGKAECPGWNGPYLPAGFNSGDYNKDAWGEEIIYDPLAGRLISKGANKTLETCNDNDKDSDDICLNIYNNEINEAKPVNKITGNINFSLFNSTSYPVTSLYYKITVTYKDKDEIKNQETNCVTLNIDSINSGETKSFVQAFIFSLANVLRKGQIITVRSDLFNDSFCNNNIASTGMNVFVSSMSEELFINLPFSCTIK